jgi:hypothetical protein
MSLDYSRFSPYLYKPSISQDSQETRSQRETQSALLRQIAHDLKKIMPLKHISQASTPAQSIQEILIGNRPLETEILEAKRPFEIKDTEVIEVNGLKGLWSNKREVETWQGVYPISEYPINQDDEPEIIRKETNQAVIYKHEVAVRFLKPPSPPPPGDLIIKQENNIPVSPAPPVIIRQPPPRPKSVEPLVIREEPPKIPHKIESQIITIPGKTLDPPPRKVIVEKFGQLPDKPQDVIIEKWLPFKDQVRNVVFVPSNPDPPVEKLKNLIIEWQTPKVIVKEETKDLGIIQANPEEYAERYKGQLKTHDDIIDYVNKLHDKNPLISSKNPQKQNAIKLEGDLEALKLIDLDAHGLSEYKYLLNEQTTKTSVKQQLLDLFTELDIGKDGIISFRDGERCLLIMNSKIGTSYGERDIVEFFNKNDNEGYADYEEFKMEFLESIF